MKHIDEGQILTLRDGQAGASSDQDQAHLSTCDTCQAALDDARTRQGVVARALTEMDTPWDVARARVSLRQRIAALSPAEDGVLPFARSPRRAIWGMSRAAGLLLVTAAALSALPGSPVRDWVSRMLPAPEGGVPATTETSPSPARTAAEEEATGVRFTVGTGPLRVVVDGATSGAEIHVRWVPGADAAVFAPAGSRFTSAAGRLEARVTPGTVQIEVPHSAGPVVVEVGGRIYLRRTDAGLDVTGPVAAQSASEIVFRIP